MLCVKTVFLWSSACSKNYCVCNGCSLLFRNRIFDYCNESSSPFLYFFQVYIFFNMVLWVFRRHFNLTCTISYGCINNLFEPTAFLRNLKHEPIADHFKLIHPAVGRKNCDRRGFLSTISFFLWCWRKRNYILIHFFSLAWIRKQKDISLRLAQFPFDS